MSEHESDARPASAEEHAGPESGTPDFQSVFVAASGAVVVLAPDSPRFTILAASDAYLAAGRRSREALIGRPLFEVFPDANPENPAATGVANLRSSLETVLRTRASHAMPVQRYDGERPDGTWAVGYWVLRNVPVLGPDGAVRYLLHEVEDVTDRVAERDATQAAERRAAELRAVLESMSDAVYIGTVGGITLANAAALEQLGYPTREELNRHIGTLAAEIRTRDAETGEFIPVERQAFARALGGEHVVQDVIVRHRGTGEDRVVRCAATPVVVDGQVIAAVAVNTDVTNARGAAAERERLLAASEAARAEAVRARAETEAAGARAAAVLESIADAFYLLDRDWRFTYVNDAAEPLLQTTREALLGRTLWEAFPGVLGSAFEGPYREAMATGRVASLEAYFAPLGTWFDVRTYPWAGGLMVHFRDIGARKAAEAERERLLADADAARARAERAADRLARLHRVGLALASSVTPDALAGAVVREGAPAVGATVGVVTRLSDDGREFQIIASHGLPDDAAATWSRFPNASPSPHADALAARTPLFLGSAAEYERRFPDLRGLRRSAGAGATAALPLVVAGEPFGVLSFGFADAQAFSAEDQEFLMTIANQCAQALERARLFGAEQAARREAEDANRAKSQFLATMSHELRTPLNAIGGYAELMELGIRGPITAEQATDRGRIQQSQRHLLGLINGVLNYARVEAGAVHYAVEDVPLAEVLTTCEALIAPQARAKGLELVVPGGPAVDRTLRVRGDREKVQQIVLNLLSNAVNFTDAGGRLTVEASADAGGVRVRVRDTGVGIAADQLARVFEPFVQVDARLTRTRGGTGLGLAISRDLARGMGGDLTVESVLGTGSTFTLVLPRA